MDSTHPLSQRLALAVAALTIGAAGCQDMRTFMTGEPFEKAPEHSERVEVELFVRLDEAVFADLDGDAVRTELELATHDTVLDLADVGLRFYAIPTDDYGDADAHPEHVLRVEIESLTVHTEQELVEQEGQEPWMRTFVDHVSCTASAAVEKRRPDGPPLVVGRARGVGRTGVDDEPHGPTAFAVVHESEAELTVSKHALLETIEEAVIVALREVVEPVDRELAGPAPTRP